MSVKLLQQTQGINKVFFQNGSFQSKAKLSDVVPAFSFPRDRQEIPWLIVSKRRVSVCARTGRDCSAAHEPNPQDAPKWLNKAAWPRNCWLCSFFLLGSRNSIIEAEQEEWCSQEATRSSCACQYAKVNMQPTAHYTWVLAYRRWVLGLGEW